MADFNKAIQPVLLNEGGFNKNLGDGQGITYRGITAVSDPDFPGWPLIRQKMSLGSIKEETIFPELETTVKAYYQKKYWSMSKGVQLTSDGVASMLLSFSIASGGWATITNKAINIAMGNKVVTENSTITQMSINYLNQYPALIYKVLYNERIAYMKRITFGSGPHRGELMWNYYGNSWTRMMSFFPKTIDNGFEVQDPQKKK